MPKVIKILALAMALTLGACVKITAKGYFQGGGGGGGDAIITQGGHRFRLYAAWDSRWFNKLRAAVYATNRANRGLFQAFAQANGAVVEERFINLDEIRLINLGNTFQGSAFLAAIIPLSSLNFGSANYVSETSLPWVLCMSLEGEKRIHTQIFRKLNAASPPEYSILASGTHSLPDTTEYFSPGIIPANRVEVTPGFIITAPPIDPELYVTLKLDGTCKVESPEVTGRILYGVGSESYFDEGLIFTNEFP